MFILAFYSYTIAPLHCGVEFFFAQLCATVKNWLGIRDPVAVKMSVSECVQ